MVSGWPFGRTVFFSEDLKEELRKPLGILYTGDVYESSRKAVDEIKKRNPRKIITVGDITTRYFVLHNMKPDVVIIDNRFERVPFRERIDLAQYKIVRIVNPAGSITPEAATAVFRAINAEEKVAVIVEGEEDLLALPALLAAGENDVIAYGQPKQGCVVIYVNEEKKNNILNLLLKSFSIT